MLKVTRQFVPLLCSWAFPKVVSDGWHFRPIFVLVLFVRDIPCTVSLIVIRTANENPQRASETTMPSNPKPPHRPTFGSSSCFLLLLSSERERERERGSHDLMTHQPFRHFQFFVILFSGFLCFAIGVWGPCGSCILDCFIPFAGQQANQL